MNLIPLFLLFFSIFDYQTYTKWLDLEKKTDEFILEIKQLHIADYQDAFNPSIIRYQERLLLIFRIRDPILLTTNQMGAVWLDEEFNINSHVFPLIFNHGDAGSMAQDPRLITLGDNLYIIYNDTLGSFQKHIRRMFVAKLEFNGDAFLVQNPQMLTSFENEKRGRHEKNWTPFTYHGKLFLTYSINPHRIYKPILNKNRCLSIASTETLTDWSFGELRGGSQAFLVGNEYLSFFHSSIDIETLQSNGKKMTHYFMGAYAFEKDPPFKITKISKKPIIGKNFYNGKNHKTWKPLRVVFPGGYVFDQKHIWLTYGRQDHEIWIVKMDKIKLLQSLKKVN